MTTPPILRSIRFEPFLRPRVSTPSVSVSSKEAARVVFAPGLATGAAILRVFVRTPTAAPPTTRANRLTEYSPAPTSSDATRSSAASGMLSKAPLTSAATMYGGRVTGSGPATGLSSFPLASTSSFPPFFFRFLETTGGFCAERHRRMNGANRRCTSL